MRGLLFFLFALLLASCASEGANNFGAKVSEAQSSYESEKSPDNALKLITSYINYVNDHKEGDDSNNAQALENAIEVARENKLTTQAMNLMHIYVRDFQDESKVGDYIQGLSEYFRAANRAPVADALLIGLKKRFPSHPASSNAPDGEIGTLIDQAALGIFDDSLKVIRRNIAAQYVDLCEAHALTLPDDAMSPKYLHKAAETARTMRHTNKALNLYDWILAKYPQDSLSSQALFLKAYTLDDMLNKEDEAEPLYKELISKYPDSDFADDAQFQLDNLGKTNEEVLQEILKKAQEQQANQ